MHRGPSAPSAVASRNSNYRIERESVQRPVRFAVGEAMEDPERDVLGCGAGEPNEAHVLEWSLDRSGIMPLQRRGVPNLALFDFDGTITSHDTFTPFIYYAVDPQRLAVGKVVLGSKKAERVLERYDLRSYGVVYAYGDTPDDDAMLHLASKRYYRWPELDE
jgi:hypothetical protein